MTQLTEEIDARVPEAVESALGVKVLSAEWIKLGIINRVYRVETGGGRFVVKVFRSRMWPEESKLEWIEKQLAGLGILHPRTIFSSRDASVFPNGFAIAEHIEGKDAWEAIDDGSLTTERFSEELGRILRGVHSVRVRAYGHLCNGEGVYTDFIEQRLAKTTKDVDQIATRDDDLYDVVRERTRQRLLPFKHLYRPVLTHGDPNPHNCILTESGQLALVDWDNAACSIWLRDYAHLTYRLLTDESGREAFFNGYGATDLDRETIQRIERTFHLIWDYNSLSDPELRSDSEEFSKTKERLLRLLSEP
ncbi:MAG TPA: aminoglycoside phosphotransferase family protein [Pyrinomonadaceae bacterium]|nr:aminoglycoside phosphotransferase family protein [Pyrinomonadaceae bacterium]